MVSGKSRAVLFDDREFFNRLFDMLASIGDNWAEPNIVIRKAILKAFLSPSLMWGGIKFWAKKFWVLKDGIIRGKGVHRINFFIHNFMDAEKLECERCETCVFMVATTDGPLSMCVHNAKRDQMISKPVRDANGKIIWNPLPSDLNKKNLPIKKLKGRLRNVANVSRKTKARQN